MTSRNQMNIIRRFWRYGSRNIRRSETRDHLVSEQRTALRDNLDSEPGEQTLDNNDVLGNEDPANAHVDMVPQGSFSKTLQRDAIAETENPSDFNGDETDIILPNVKTTTKRLKHVDYTVGWICALPLEMIAARVMLDEEHLSLPNSAGDDNAYQLGAIGNHNVVIACVRAGVYGLTSATAVAIGMVSTYPNSVLRPLLVGIAGGVPSHKDIRLGDVVIGTPSSTHPAVHQYDSGKTIDGGVLKTTTTLNKPAAAWLNTLSLFQSEIALQKVSISTHVSRALKRLSSTDFSRPGSETDILHNPECEHTGDSCVMHQVSREPRQTLDPTIHFGCIASGNQVIKDARTRDRIATESSGILCFEMEAAGIMDYMPCLVIRGICDYCDMHKAKNWQRYSALTAAAVGKTLLSILPTNQPDIRIRNSEAIRSQKQVAHDGFSSASSFESSRWIGSTKRSERQNRLLQALAFQNQDTRRATIREAHTDTCKWLFAQPQLCEWTDPMKYDKHHGVLWIKGKPGAGKSVVMKHLVEHVKELFPNNKNIVVASFFFNARGEELGRTTIGMYRALLGQIFKRLPEMKSLLDSSKLDPDLLSSSRLTIEILEDLLQHVIKELGSKFLVLFIDALDECPETQVREMVHLLAKLSDLADKNHLHICFASRHYPHISIRRSSEFTLERQKGHTEDILRYLDAELILEDTVLTAELKQRMLAKSRQIFLWIVLVVSIMKREYDHGRVHALSALLDSIPDEVTELFRGILTRDSENFPQLLAALQWVLYAERPLRLEELYHAVLYATPAFEHSLPAHSVPTEDMQRYILSCSKGLLEQTVSETSRIQFIHETVREFLLEPRGLQGLSPGFEGINEDESHEFLARSCIHYIEQVQRMNPISNAEQKIWLHEREGYVECIEEEKRFPFMSYAKTYALRHAERADSLGISQAGFLKTLNHIGWYRWPREWQERDSIGMEARVRNQAIVSLQLLQRPTPSFNFISLGIELASDGLLQLFTHWMTSVNLYSKWDTTFPLLLLPFLHSMCRFGYGLVKNHKMLFKICEIVINKDYELRHLSGFIRQRSHTLYFLLGGHLDCSPQSSDLDIVNLRNKMDSILNARWYDKKPTNQKAQSKSSRDDLELKA